jgi:putative tricarboxylic transport membrane protein
MKLLFLSALFLAGLWYGWVAYDGLPVFTRRGRIGPGFFPMAIAVSFLVITASAIVSEALKMRREGRLLASEFLPPLNRDLLTIIGLTLLFGAGLNFLGAYSAIFLFLIASLSFFNPRRHLANLAVSLAVPGVIALLFQVWLGASIPRGLLF